MLHIPFLVQSFFCFQRFFKFQPQSLFCSQTENMSINVEFVDPFTLMPARSTSLSHLDFYLPRRITLHPLVPVIVPLGLKMEIPSHMFLKLEVRSSAAQSGVFLLGGVIDSDYRGEIKALLVCLADEKIEFHPGARIVQGCFLPLITPSPILGPVADNTERGANGFGSTGR